MSRTRSLRRTFSSDNVLLLPSIPIGQLSSANPPSPITPPNLTAAGPIVPFQEPAALKDYRRSRTNIRSLPITPIEIGTGPASRMKSVRAIPEYLRHEATVPAIDIDTRIITDEDFIKEVRTIFNITGELKDIDNDLLLIAFNVRCNDMRLKSKFGICTMQALEFYGDRMLYTVVTDMMYDILGINTTPGYLTFVTQELTTNRFITEIMLNKKACDLVRGIRTVNISLDTRRVHNSCADAFEALIGAFYVHLKYKQKDNIIKNIRDWLEVNTLIIDKLVVFVKYVETEFTEKHRREINRKIIEAGYPVSGINRSNRILVVDPKTSIEEIYQKLGLDLNASIDTEPETGYIIIYGPDGTVMGFAATLEAAKIDAIKSLLDNGYISYSRNIWKPRN